MHYFPFITPSFNPFCKALLGLRDYFRSFHHPYIFSNRGRIPLVGLNPNLHLIPEEQVPQPTLRSGDVLPTIV